MYQSIAWTEKVRDHEGEEKSWSLELEAKPNAGIEDGQNPNQENRSPTKNIDSVGWQREMGNKAQGSAEKTVSSGSDLSTPALGTSRHYPQPIRNQPKWLMH